MIIRHIPMKSARLSSFSSLIQYLCDEQNKQERVGKISISNCNSADPLWAVQEVLATQAKNQRAKGDKTYHMLISFAPGENPSHEALRAIEDQVVSSIGFKEHQRISVVHHDTDNLHIHVATNKIHPKTFNMVEPFRAYKTFADIATKLEIEYGFETTNHQTRKGRSENLADDMEQHSGIESLINWMKRHCKGKIDAANSWMAIHSILAEYGVVIRARANGFVFCNAQGLTIKASSVSRNFSKKNIESRLGAFVSPPLEDNVTPTNVYRYEPLNKKALGSELYARYQHEKVHSKTLLSEKIKQLRAAKAGLIEKAKRRGRIKRTALKLMSISKMGKKYLYQQISKTLMSDIAQVRKNYAKAHSSLINTYQNKTWADWLQQKAQEGDQDALNALRYRNRKNKNDYALSGAGSGFSSVDVAQIDSITKEGTEIYRMDMGVIRDDGKEIKISKGGSIASLKNALEMARQRYGNCLSVNGSPLFKKIILQVVVQHHIPIMFDDLDMETQRQKLTLEQEKNHEQSRSERNNDRRRTPGSHEVVGATARNRRSRTKPNTCSVKRSSPAKSQNSLRNLSQLDVVQLTGRGQMLLQDNAYDKLERKRLQPDNDVRRKVFGLKKKQKKPQYR